MRKRLAVGVVLSTMLWIGAAAQDARTVVSESTKAMGAENLTSITYSGSATSANFGQTKNISGPFTR